MSISVYQFIEWAKMCLRRSKNLRQTPEI